MPRSFTLWIWWCSVTIWLAISWGFYVTLGGCLEDHPRTCKWLVPPPLISHLRSFTSFGRGPTTLFRGLTITMVANYLLNGMILQVGIPMPIRNSAKNAPIISHSDLTLSAFLASIAWWDTVPKKSISNLPTRNVTLASYPLNKEATNKQWKLIDIELKHKKSIHRISEAYIYTYMFCLFVPFHKNLPSMLLPSLGLFPIFPNPPGGCQGSASEFCRHFLEGRCTYGTWAPDRVWWEDLFNPKNPWTLQWRGWNLYDAGVWGPQNSQFWGVRILREGDFFYFVARINHHIKPPFGEHVFIFSKHQTSKSKVFADTLFVTDVTKTSSFWMQRLVDSEHRITWLPGKSPFSLGNISSKRSHVSVPCWFTRG